MDDFWEGVLLLVMLAFGAFFGWLYTASYFADDYKQGQIDALTGKVRVRLHLNADSTREWIYTPKHE